MKTIAIDFDGVIHSYKGWDGDEPTGEPIEGALSSCQELAKYFRVIVFTTRKAKGYVRQWLDKHGFGMVDEITNEKSEWMLLVDDRCIRFDGDWPRAFQQIIAFEPYWRAQQ